MSNNKHSANNDNNDNNDSNSIITKHGCKCKKEYMAHGKKIKNKCTRLGETKLWCVVDGKCGETKQLVNNKMDYWDYCSRDRESLFEPRWTYGKNYFWNQILGSIIFILIFVLLVPYILYKNKYYAFLSVYMPNFDLLASAITYNGGPYTWELFNELYNSKSENIYSYISTLLINFLSLIGVVYLVSHVVKKSRSIIKGCMVGIIMIFLTYLVPNDIIVSMQNVLSDFLINKTNLSPSTSGLLYLIITFFGLFIAGIFISIEEYILIKHDSLILKITKWISRRFYKTILY